MLQLRWVWKNMKGCRALFLFGIFMQMAFSGMSIINPKISQYIIDNIFTGASTETVNATLLINMLILMVITTLVRTIMGYTAVLTIEKSSIHTVSRIKERIFDKLQAQDMGFYDRYRTGDIMTRYTGDVDMVRHAVTYLFRIMASQLVLLIASLCIFLATNVTFTLILLSVTPFIFIGYTLYFKRVRPLYMDLREKMSNLNTFSQENIEGNRVVKAFAREDYENKRMDEKNGEFKEANTRASFEWLKFFPLFEGLSQSMTVIIILVGGLLIINGSLTMGELWLFSNLSYALIDPMRTLGTILNDLQRFFASVNKVIEIYEDEPKIFSTSDAKVQEKERFQGKVEFQDVTFKFGRKAVLDGVNFTAEPGQTIGILGPTGSGKTTLVNCISRFYDISQGRVLVDDVDVKKWDLHSLRKNIGMATQDVFLFSDTVEGNIAYGAPDISLEEVQSFANTSAAQFINDLSEGYDTIIGERGVGLSGGQRQRIALARALAVRPAILVLDDTTSAVDMETEKYIQEQLEHLDFSCTKFIIAQRISSLQNADKILVLIDGKIAEEGTHQELLDQKGYYYETYMLQNVGV